MGLKGLAQRLAQTREYVKVTAGIDRRCQIGAEVDRPTIPGPDRSGPATTARGLNWRPLLVYFHGGGFVIADLDVYDPVCKLIARDAGSNVLSGRLPAGSRAQRAALGICISLGGRAPGGLGADPNLVGGQRRRRGRTSAAGVFGRCVSDDAVDALSKPMTVSSPGVDATANARLCDPVRGTV